MVVERYARQVLVFGQEGQLKIQATRVGIVGLGGTGSHVAQALAYLGVCSFVLVDDDSADRTNLNRLIGAVPEDAEHRALKVLIARRMIEGINPSAVVKAIPRNLRSRNALEELTACQVIFGCVDADGPRLILMELAAAYEATLIDLATEIHIAEGQVGDFGGRVVVSRPREYCVACAKVVSMDQAKWELATRDGREVARRHGYGLDRDEVAPAVVSLNGVVANLAVTEFLVMVTGLREPVPHLTYHADRGIVNRRTDGPQEHCYTCGYLVGQRDRADIFRYVLPESESDGAGSPVSQSSD